MTHLSTIKLWQLESALSDIETFAKPKLKLEQYTTQPHLAAHVLYTIQTSFGDIEGKSVADLGCGSGMLTVGAALLGCGICVGFDIDPDAIELSQSNCAEAEVTDSVDFVLCDVNTLVPRRTFDVVITNPPFGTQGTRGADMVFLDRALQLATESVYSFHKTASRDFIEGKAKEFGSKGKVIAQLRFDLPSSYKHHKKSSIDIEVDLWRFEIVDA